jgi:2-methylisocitrate lyase-like PEP mutase family enzyme
MSGHLVAEPSLSTAPIREHRCDLLRSLHVAGAPLLLPNVWDVASARAVAAAGFPVVATSSGAVAASLGHEDHERAPREEMLAATARIARAVEVPVTVDAEAGYGMDAADLVSVLMDLGVAGCNLEDTDHRTGLVVNARIDVFLAAGVPGPETGRQIDLVDEALRRATAYVDAGADCVFPIALWERDALVAFLRQAPGSVNILRIPPAPSEAELADLGVARISYGHLLHGAVMEHFRQRLASLRQLRAE